MDILKYIDSAADQLRHAHAHDESFTPMLAVERHGSPVAFASGIEMPMVNQAATLMCAMFRGDAVVYTADSYYLQTAITDELPGGVHNGPGASEAFAAGHPDATEALMVARVDHLLADVRFATYRRDAETVTMGIVEPIQIPHYPIQPADITFAMAEAEAAAPLMPDDLSDRQLDGQALAYVGPILQVPIWLAAFDTIEEAQEVANSAQGHDGASRLFVTRRVPED